MDDEYNRSEETDAPDEKLECIKKKLYHLQLDVDQCLICAEGYQPKNVMNFFQHKRTWLATLHEVAKMVAQLEPEKRPQGANYLVAAYYHLGTSCSWTEMWHYSYAILREGLPFAQKAGNGKALARYVREMNYYANGPRMTLPMLDCRTVAELDALLKAESAVGDGSPKETSHRTSGNTSDAAPRETGRAARRNVGTTTRRETGSAHEEKKEDHGCLLKLLGVIVFIAVLWLL